MQFDYTINGLNVDFLGAVGKIKQAQAYESQRLASEDERAEKQRLQRLYAQRNELLAANPQADTTAIDRSMYGVDPAFVKGIRELDSELDEEQQESLFGTVYETKLLVDRGLTDDAMTNLEVRNQMLKEMGVDNKHTQALLDAYDSGDGDRFNKLMDYAVELGRTGGYIPMPSPADLDVDTSNPFFDEDGAEYFNVINNATGELKRQYTGDTRVAQDDAPGSGISQENLPAQYNKAVVDYTTQSNEASSAATKAAQMAQSYANKVRDSGWMADAGIGARVEELSRELFGTEDEVSMIRRDATRFMNTEIVNSLPPGIASDRDIALIKAGFPSDVTNPEQLVNWFNAYSSVKQAESKKKLLQAEFIEATRGVTQAKITGTVGGIPVKRGESFGDFMKRYNETIRGQLSAKPVAELTDEELLGGF